MGQKKQPQGGRTPHKLGCWVVWVAGSGVGWLGCVGWSGWVLGSLLLLLSHPLLLLLGCWFASTLLLRWWFALISYEEIASLAPEIPLEHDQLLKEGGRFWDDINDGYLSEDLVLATRREEIDWIHSEGVYTCLWIRHAKKN